MLTLNRKIDFAIKLLQSIPQDGPIEMPDAKQFLTQYFGL